ncbi:helix-turn-helix domain-containing protein [Acinetobacter nosocomialis]|uniref:helix-turn-helix domain-containing protein n=1 Tax=Acinetobacter nosocomialis TaxID=106654 RepID=UPI0024B7531B|nr:helix-turn-helix transcriptional regulator [Acinetobacter nosocomialis]MDI9659416.1 helix-turn-helix transcriptional regulator [Acinetobacter nosocomialis]
MTTWSQIISDLQDKGKGNMTQQEIAESVHCSQNYISDLKKGKKGKRISHEIAQGLINLHQQKIVAEA